MNAPIRWQDLSLLEQNQFGNGCGPAWIPAWLTALVFGWFFEASCRRHDFGYARGGSSADRYAVDMGFYQSMLRDAMISPFAMRRKVMTRVAHLFYILVRLFGWMRFNYGPYRSKNELVEVTTT